jgi:hypothetical protein
VSKCLADANKQLITKLEEQRNAMLSDHRTEMEDLLERQAADLTADFEYKAQMSKQEYDSRFQNILSDVEKHKLEVIEAHDKREKYYTEHTSTLEAELAEMTKKFNAL